MRKEVRTLRTWVCRVYLEVARQLHVLPEAARPKAQDPPQRTCRILSQSTKNKLYALHVPEVDCIIKGKARTPYEFGVKVSIATTLKEGLVLGMCPMSGNLYDGHTPAETQEQLGILTSTDQPVRHSHRVQGLPGRGDRRRAHPALGITTRRHQGDESHDQAAQRHQASHRANEDRLAAGPQSAQRRTGRCAARGNVRRLAQPAPNLGLAATLLRPL